MRFPILAVAVSLALSACSGEPEPVAVEPVEDVWIRLPAVQGRPAAIYFELNGGDAGARLIAIDSDRAESVELHETFEEDGAMRMRPISGVDVAAGETVEFEPGGRHGMLFGIDETITPGTRLTLSFRFDDGGSIEADAVAIAAGDEAPFDEDGEQATDASAEHDHAM